MIQQTVRLSKGEGTGYVIPAGPVNLVHVVARRGMVGCGAFDVGALAGFGYPAARVRPARDTSIATIDDLLEGIVKEANSQAEEIGIRTGMTGREALDLLC